MPKNNFNGAKLKEAIQFRGMKMTHLADITGISKQSLSLYIKGLNVPSFDKIWLISNALNFPSDFFLDSDFSVVSTGNTYFRSQAAATKGSQKMQSIKMEYVARFYSVLQKYVDFPTLNLPKVQIPQDSSIIPSDEIEDISRQVRKEWKLGDLPIENIQYLLESHGIVVTFFKSVKKEIDAFSQKVNLSTGPVYIVSLVVGEKPIERLRFDMGHELGHILIHPWDDQEEDLSRDLFLLRERQANLFASAFLLPRDSFVNDIKAFPTSLDYYVYLKRKWHVSAQAMIYRARQLGEISENQFYYLMKTISKKGLRLREPGDIPGKLNNTVFQSAIDLLFDGGYLDSHQLRSEFGKSGILLRDEDLEELMGLKEGTLEPDPVETLSFETGIKTTSFSIRKSP